MTANIIEARRAVRAGSPGWRRRARRSSSSTSSSSSSSRSSSDSVATLVLCSSASSDDIFRARVRLATADGDLPARRASFHLLWNMLFLWMVGREMESFYGSATSSRCTSSARSSARSAGRRSIPSLGHHGTSMLGASGAVMAVVVLYTLYYPHREILLFFVLPVEMWLLVVDLPGPRCLPVPRTAGQRTSRSPRTSRGPRTAISSRHFDLRWSRFSWRRVTRSPAPR